MLLGNPMPLMGRTQQAERHKGTEMESETVAHWDTRSCLALLEITPLMPQ